MLLVVNNADLMYITAMTHSMMSIMTVQQPPGLIRYPALRFTMQALIALQL